MEKSIENFAYLQTPSQTVGPYFAYGLTSEQYLYDFKQLVDNQMVDRLEKEKITIIGQVFDGEGALIPDALVEIWDHTHNLFGRHGTGTEKDNSFVFQCLKPKAIGENAPFLSVILSMRGQLIHSYTRIYFDDEATLNVNDSVLNSISVDRQKTLLAEKKGDFYQFNIYMQGENETVFFEI